MSGWARTRSRRSSHLVHDTAPITGIMIPGARGKDLRPRSPCQRVVEGVVHLFFFPGNRVTTDQRVVAEQEIQEVESAKRASTQGNVTLDNFAGRQWKGACRVGFSYDY